jgi:tetratricopeptide (TPR) repeat protein
LFGLVDRIAAQLIAAHRGDSGLSVAGLAGQTTHSLPALKAYLEGERQFRRGAFRQALSGFQEAIALDSTFALAYYRLAIAYGWASNDSALAAARQAVRWSARLAQPARDLVDALALYEQGNADQAERRYREIIARRPMEVDAIFQLGETLFHDNPPRGRPSAEGRPWFERALAFNQGDPPVIHLLEIAGLERDYPAFDSLVRRVKPESHFWLTGRMVRAFGRGTEAERRAVEQEFRSVTDRDLATVTLHALFLLEDRLSVERVVRLLDDPARPSELRLLHHLLLAHLEMSAGRWRAAERALASAATLDPVRAVEHAVVLHSLPGLPIPESRVKAVRDQLAKVDSLARPVPSELLGSADEVLYPELRHYLEGQLAIRAGSWREAADRAAAIERLTGRRDHPIGVGMAAGLRGASALGQGRPADALAALAPSMPRNHPDLLGYSPFPGFRHERWARAEAWRQRGLLDEALAGFASFAEHSPWGRLYLAPGHLRRAEIYEQLGRPEEAAQEYRRAAELWREGDEEFRAVADRARVKAGSPGA